MEDGGVWLAHIWRDSSSLVEVLLIILINMFVWVLVETAEKSLRYGLAIWETRRLLKAGTLLSQSGAWQQILAQAEKRKRSHVARVLVSGLREFRRAQGAVSPERSIELAERESRVAANRLYLQLRQGLSALATIATTAPLVALFGTVIGILDSFGGYSGPPSFLLALIANRIAQALATTSLGLLVAVLAVWCFNYLTDRLAMLDAEMKIASLELWKYLEAERRNGRA
jgi:biopolymer transport protein ExbB/TolQ